MPTVTAILRAQLASSDRPGAAALAHKLSGVAANLALSATHRAAQQAERVLADCSRALAAALAEIDQYAPTVEQAKEASGTDAFAAPALSAAEQLALKNQLYQLLQALDSDNPARVKKEMTLLAQQLPPDALVAVKASVQDYDFRGAETRTRQLASNYGINLEIQS